MSCTCLFHATCYMLDKGIYSQPCCHLLSCCSPSFVCHLMLTGGAAAAKGSTSSAAKKGSASAGARQGGRPSSSKLLLRLRSALRDLQFSRVRLCRCPRGKASADPWQSELASLAPRSRLEMPGRRLLRERKLSRQLELVTVCCT